MSPLECSGFQPNANILVDGNEVVTYQCFSDGIKHKVKLVDTELSAMPIIGLPTGGGFLNGKYLEPGRKIVSMGIYIKST
jgi:hypothetical protein